MENSKTNEGELTSTMGNLLSTSKDDKNEASDSTPTSSTDAFTTTTTSQIVADDPISSTSSDILESKKSTVKVNDVAHSSTNVISSGSVMSMSMRDNSSPIVSEKDLLVMNITDTSTERITENVDDIVQDLENLLGEPTESFDFTIKSKDSRGDLDVADNKGVAADIDAYSAELQMLGGRSSAPKEIPKPTIVESIVNIQKNVNQETKNISQPKVESISETVETEHETAIEEIESSESENQNTEDPTETDEIKADTIEKLSIENIENCQFEIISASSANIEVISLEKSELVEVQNVTSTHLKSENVEEDTAATVSVVEEGKRDVDEDTAPTVPIVEERKEDADEKRATVVSAAEERKEDVNEDTKDATAAVSVVEKGQQDLVEDTAVVASVAERKRDVDEDTAAAGSIVERKQNVDEDTAAVVSVAEGKQDVDEDTTATAFVPEGKQDVEETLENSFTSQEAVEEISKSVEEMTSSENATNSESRDFEKTELITFNDATDEEMEDVNSINVPEESSAVDEQKQQDVVNQTEPEEMGVEEQSNGLRDNEKADTITESTPEKLAPHIIESVSEDPKENVVKEDTVPEAILDSAVEAPKQEAPEVQDVIEPTNIGDSVSIEQIKMEEAVNESPEKTSFLANIEEFSEQTESMICKEAEESTQQTGSLVNDEAAEESKEQTGLSINEEGSEEFKEQTSSLVNEEAAKESKEQTASLVNEEAAEESNEQICSLVNEETAEGCKEQTASLVNEEAAKEFNEQTCSLVNEEAAQESNGNIDALVNMDVAAESQELESGTRSDENLMNTVIVDTNEDEDVKVGESICLEETKAIVEELESNEETEVCKIFDNRPEEVAPMVSETKESPDIKEIEMEVTGAIVEEAKDEETTDVTIKEIASNEDEVKSEVTTDVPDSVGQEVKQVLPSVLEETKVEESTDVALTDTDNSEVETRVSVEDTEKTDVRQVVEEPEFEQKQSNEEVQEKLEFLNSEAVEKQTDTQTPKKACLTITFDAPELEILQPIEQSKIPDDIQSIIPEVTELPTSEPVEESKCEGNVEMSAVENSELTDTNESTMLPVDFIPETLEMRSHSLAEDLDLLVQDAVSVEPLSAALLPVETDPANFEDESLEVPTSSVDNLKTMEGIIENDVLPLAMDDVSDLDVLNAISTLSDNKSSIIPEIEQDVQENDALLSSSTLEQSAVADISFESNTETDLPTVDEIFAEPSQQSQELQDDNLETLLAVASLQSVDYNMPPVDDYTPPVEEVPIFVPEELIPPPVQELPSFDSVEEPKIDETVQGLAEVKESSSEETVKTDEVDKSEVNKVVHNVEKVARGVERVKDEVGEVVQKQQENKLKEPLVINIEDSEKDRVYSPKITIKPIKPPGEEVEAVASGSSESESKGSLKMTITKQSDNTHSILKIYDPTDDSSHNHEDQSQPEHSVPKLIIKPIVHPNEQPHSPKISTRSSKVFSPSSSQRSASPRITIKPILKPEESVAPLKITIKPVLKHDESHKQKHSPKLTIKPIIKPDEESGHETKVHSPRVTIKPIVKHHEEIEQIMSPRITIKPIVKPVESVLETVPVTPRVTIKPVVKHPEKEKNVEIVEQMERSSPKITIKPIVKPQEPEPPPNEDFEESVKERIVLKINKGTIPGSSKESRKREAPLEEEKSEKLAKIKLKFSKEGGHPQIVQNPKTLSPSKRPAEADHDKNKRQRIDTEQFLPGVTITPIGPATHSKLKEMLSRNDFSSNKVVTIDDDDDDVTIVEEPAKSSPIVISEESNQDSIMNAAIDVRDPISDIPVFAITPDSVKTLNPQPAPPVVEVPVVLPAPRKRGRPRKVPLQVREDFKDPKEEEPKPVVVESTRPKRSCRGQSVRTTLGIKPRKPRGPGRGRGSKRGMGTRGTSTPPETPPKAAKEPKLSGAKLKELKEDSFLLSDKSEVKTIEIDDGLQKSPSNSLLAPPHSDTSTADRADIVMYEEETRMSAETTSRAQTPAKQVVTTIPAVDLVEESQSSVQSTATTESVKVRRGPRLEVHQEPEGAVISADQLAEYYWMGGGPYMLQEQVAQFLGIKSFKRKYPNIQRRVVDMQERDFIRESGLAGEAMCDLGLTAVNSSDILDIMYSDFQDKYEEYCKHQRDRQAKDLINKQKALSLAASQEKAKMDITQQAVQSAANWNATFNKARRDQRKSCMDLQTLTIHFPKGKIKQINKPKIGYYPVALVPGQFTDYYRDFTPTEINNLPINTMCYDPIMRGIHQEMDCDSQTDGSGSESDSSTSDSDSSYSGSSDAEDCTLCKPTPKRVAAAAQ